MTNIALNSTWNFLEADSHDEDWNRCSPLTISVGDSDLAQIFSNADSTVDQSREYAVDAARLIAAAPEVTKELINLVSILSSDPALEWKLSGHIEAALKALAKAI